MDTTALIVWHSFLQSTSPEKRNTLLQCVSPELIALLQQGLATDQNLQQGIEAAEEELSHVHPSWLAPLLRSLPENEIKLFLASLTFSQIQGIKESLLFPHTLLSPSLLGQSFLKKTLFDMISPEDLLPISCLPSNSLNALLNLSSSELTSLIDLLSMHDLSVEIRHIIETSKLKEIYKLLTKAQVIFLKTLLHKKEAVMFKKIGLVSWNGDRQALRFLLLQRGINRIAKCLYDKSPSLLWYIAHRLDAEKGQLLMQLCTPMDHPQASTLLSEQVVELISALKTHSPQLLHDRST